MADSLVGFTTGASTVAVSATDSFSAALGQIFGNSDVQLATGNALGTAINVGLGALGLPGFGGETPEQKAARLQAEREAAAAKQKQMLIIGGGVAVVAVVLIVIFIRSR